MDDLTKMTERIAVLLGDYGTEPFGDVRLNADRIAAKVMTEVVGPELDLAFRPSMYLDIQLVLDEALGTEEADGAGGGIVADVALLAEQKRTAETERDALKAALPGDVARQIAEVEAARAALPEDERRRREAADAPLLRLQLAGWYRQAKEAQVANDRVRADAAEMQRQTGSTHDRWKLGVYAQASRTLGILDAALDHPTDTTGETR